MGSFRSRGLACGQDQRAAAGPAVGWPSSHQAVTSAAYWSAASSQVKWPTSMMSSLLWGSRLWRELGVDWRHRRVSPPGDDLHRRLYLRQQVAQYRKLGRVGAHVAHRLDHPVAFVGRQVILADGVGQRVPLDAGERAGHDLPRVSATEAVEVGGFDPVLQPRSQLERDRRAAAADDQAAQPAWMQGRGEQAGRGADVGADDMRVLEPEGVGGADDELAHRPRGQQRVPALGMTEPRQVDRHQMGAFGQPRPHRLEGEQAFRPRAQQQGVIVAVLALREADRQPVDDPELHLDGRVQPGGHDAAPSRCVVVIRDCIPAIVMPTGPHSYPPAHSATGQSWPGRAAGTPTGRG
jgi:hypothetical protein